MVKTQQKIFIRQGDILFEQVSSQIEKQQQQEPLETKTVALGEITGFEYRSGENHYNWKGGKTITSDGYRVVRCKGHPKAKKESRYYIREHRLIMEDYIGRYLEDDEEIHHINGDKLDNRIENLQLLSKSEHTSFSMLGNKHRQVDMSDRKCVECNSAQTYQNPIKKSPMWFTTGVENEFKCRSCYHKEYKQKKKTELLKHNPNIEFIDSGIVAVGEVTNHHHSFIEKQILLYKQVNEEMPTQLSVLDNSGPQLEHQEHLSIQFPKGEYKIRREQSYNPFLKQIQRSLD